MMAATQGGCLCGKVRYRIDGEPLATAICHCTSCQRQSGGAFSVNLLVRETGFHVTGDLNTFMDQGDSGGTLRRCFCPACGTPIVSFAESKPGLAIVKAGTLDDTSCVAPRLQIYKRSAQPWLDNLAALPAFDAAAPSR